MAWLALPSYDRDVIRPHALGNFRVFLEAVATSAAMQYYLSNRSSRAGSANENYGRELFELHTLGRDNYYNAIYDKWRKVPGALQGKPIGYIDQDVYEAARAFTGWTIEDGAGVGPGQTLPKTGKFVYVESWHDNYQKRVLASEFDPFQSPMADGRKVLDLVARHPATAHFVCRKLCRRLVSDTPSEALVAGAAEVWTKNRTRPNQIAEVVRYIATSPEFAEPGAPRSSVRWRPPRAIFAPPGLDFAPTEGVINEMAAGGAASVRLGSSNRASRYARLLAVDQRDAPPLVVDPGPHRQLLADRAVRSHPGDGTPDAFGDRGGEFLAGTPAWDAGSGGLRTRAGGDELPPEQRFPDGPKDPKAPLRHIVAYLAMAPGFQLR